MCLPASPVVSSSSRLLHPNSPKRFNVHRMLHEHQMETWKTGMAPANLNKNRVSAHSSAVAMPILNRFRLARHDRRSANKKDGDPGNMRRHLSCDITKYFWETPLPQVSWRHENPNRHHHHHGLELFQQGAVDLPRFRR